VEVFVQLYVASIVEVIQKQQHIGIEGYFRTSWKDPRLARSGNCSQPILLTKPYGVDLWAPDIYFDNSLTEWYGAGSLSISEEGDMYRSDRYHHELRCPMDYHMLPFDSQECFVKMASYSWDIDNVHTQPFVNGALVLPDEYDGNTEWELLNGKDGKLDFKLETEWFGEGENRKGYSYVFVYFHLQRRPSSYMMFVFGTCVLFCLVSWSGLFINRTVAPARVAIAVIPVLIILNLETGVTSRLPPLNYLTWLTSFLLWSKTLSLMCVFEYGLVSFLLQMEQSRDRKFEAFKHLAGIIKKKQGEEAAELTTGVRRGSMKAFGKFFAGAAEVAPEEPESSTSKYLDPTLCVDMVFRMFDMDKSGDISAPEIQRGFRKLGQYFSTDQVAEIFSSLGVDEGTLQKDKFQKLMLNLAQHMPGKAMNISFWERPPSMQVDIVFRWAYLFCLLVSMIVWLAASGA